MLVRLEKRISVRMANFGQISRVEEYRDQAASLRRLAFQTRFRESRIRLMALADSFDRLADRVEERGDSLTTAAD